MQRCGSRSTKICSTNAHKNAILPTTRNLCQGEGARAGTFAIIFDSGVQPKDVEPYCVSSTSAVDCTLSLGTPSTRSQSHSNLQCTPQLGIQHQQDDSYPLRWDFTSYEPKQTPPYAAAASAPTLGAEKACGLNWGEDPVLLARRCANCDTTSTPLWRNGPKGPKSLCNACGIRYKKEERRAASYAVTSPSTSLPSSLCTLPTATNLDPQQYERGYMYEHPSSYPAARQTVAGKSSTDSSPTLISSMYPRGEDDVMEVAALPSLSWSLNVQIPQRTMESYAPNIPQDYTYT